MVLVYRLFVVVCLAFIAIQVTYGTSVEHTVIEKKIEEMQRTYDSCTPPKTASKRADESTTFSFSLDSKMIEKKIEEMKHKYRCLVEKCK